MKNGWLYPAWGNLVLLALSVAAFGIAVKHGDMQFAVMDAICAALNLAIYQWKKHDDQNSEES